MRTRHGWNCNMTNMTHCIDCNVISCIAFWVCHPSHVRIALDWNNRQSETITSRPVRTLYNPARYIFQYISKYSSAPCDEGRTVGEVQGHADALVARRGAVWRSLMYPCHENRSPYRLFYVKSTITEGEKTKLSLLWSFVFIALYVETLFQRM